VELEQRQNRILQRRYQSVNPKIFEKEFEIMENIFFQLV